MLHISFLNTNNNGDHSRFYLFNIAGLRPSLTAYGGAVVAPPSPPDCATLEVALAFGTGDISNLTQTLSWPARTSAWPPVVAGGHQDTARFLLLDPGTYRL